MKSIRVIAQICMQNMRKWKTDYRIWMLVIVVLLLTHSYITDMGKVAAALNVSRTFWNYPFLYAQFYMKLIFTLPLLLIFCDAPFKDGNQMFVVSRAGRTRWCLGQVTYIVISSALYYLILIAATIILCLPEAEFSLEWGKLLHTVSRTNAASTYGAYYVEVSPDVLQYFTPLQAMWFTFLCSWLSGIFLGMMIYMCNCFFKSNVVGSVIGSVLILLSAFLSNDYIVVSKWFSPFSWNTLNQIDIAGLTNNPSFLYCISFYIVGILIFLLAVVFKNKKEEICSNEK